MDRRRCWVAWARGSVHRVAGMRLLLLLLLLRHWVTGLADWSVRLQRPSHLVSRNVVMLMRSVPRRILLLLLLLRLRWHGVRRSVLLHRLVWRVVCIGRRQWRRLATAFRHLRNG